MKKIKIKEKLTFFYVLYIDLRKLTCYITVRGGVYMQLNKVQMYRKAIKKTQKEIADFLNLSLDGYSKKERRVSQFTEHEIKALLQLFKKYNENLTVEDIFL